LKYTHILLLLVRMYSRYHARQLRRDGQSAPRAVARVGNEP